MTNTIQDDNVPILEDVLSKCPKRLVKDFDKISVEIRKRYLEFRKGDPEEYLEYSRGWHYVIFQYIEKYLDGKNILDVGALFGVTSVFLAKKGMNVTSLDGYVDEIPDVIKLKYDLCFLFSNLEHIKKPPLFEKYFDMVVMSEVLEHLNYNPVPVLLNLRSSMKDSGILIITTPNDREYPKVPKSPTARDCHHLEIPNWHKDAPRQAFPHSKQYVFEEFDELLENCGFKISEIVKFRHEGSHMLAIAKVNTLWKPSEKVKQIMLEQFSDYKFPSKVRLKRIQISQKINSAFLQKK
jgi:2-polyprenyl-3-methyl-5-hydroxy-6-metoxy-1,4-benzoquinol methylase